jgi:hypothetical protein
MDKLYNHHQPVIVPFYIEYVPLVADTVHTVKIFLYIGEAPPFGSFCGFEPIFQWDFSLVVFLVKIE